tara:strand:+ start:760 stop:1566 length:807 start_codon:yes stop_codon:yes gene_type:complete
MAEAIPSKKVGGHAYGRRNLQLSNTAEEGELCLYSGHAIGRFSSTSMRFDSHQACVRCVAAAREGRMSFDIDRLLKRERKRALRFWSQVDIRQPDECWNWEGCINKRTQQPQFSWRRHGISSSTQHHPQRVAMWFTWGDLGFAGVKTTCGNKYCCNPFHLIPQKIGVFVDDDSYAESFELQCQLHTLKQQIAEFNVELALKEQEKLFQQEELDERANLIFAPDSEFSERFEAVVEDMLAGRHPSQSNIIDPDKLKKPTDNEENSTNDY